MTQERLGNLVDALLKAVEVLNDALQADNQKELEIILRYKAEQGQELDMPLKRVRLPVQEEYPSDGNDDGEYGNLR